MRTKPKTGLRERLWRLIEATPHLTWMLLAKRPERFPIVPHERFARAASDAPPAAIEPRELLGTVKAKLAHGKWVARVEKNCRFTLRTAQLYMRCYRERDQIKSATVAHLGPSAGRRSSSPRRKAAPPSSIRGSRQRSAP
jgi:hypothetical protein